MQISKNKDKKSVAIIGGGFGGVSVAKTLAHYPHVDVYIIDRRNYHLFQPLLYQVAMAGLNPSEIATPIRSLFNKFSNVHVILAEVENIDVENCKIQFDGMWIEFDYIIIACGTKHFYFGNNDWEIVAPGLKNLEQATEIRRRVLTAFELAEKQKEKELQSEYLTFAVIGGGPTGVELAGAIAEMARSTLLKDYRVANLKETKVYLIEAGPRILPVFPEKLSSRAHKDLEELGVTVLINSKASALSKDGLSVNEKWIKCKTIIWAAGVKPASIAEKVKTEKDQQGRLLVHEELCISTNKNVFAIGDVAAFVNSDGSTLLGIAPVAIQQGQFVGKQIIADCQGQERGRFNYKNKGIMATIGRSRAIVSSGKLELVGLSAWLAWVFIHIIYLMRFKNKVFVFFQWIWGYFRFGYGARLIIHKTWRFYSGKKINYHTD